MLLKDSLEDGLMREEHLSARMNRMRSLMADLQSLRSVQRQAQREKMTSGAMC
jgi:hypothetical protein